MASSHDLRRVLCTMAVGKPPSRSHRHHTAGEDLVLASTCMYLSLAGYMMGGGIPGWLGEKSLLGENKLAGFRNTQQVFLSLMEYGDFPSALHEVNRGNPLA